jgi:hypothetical protein
MTRRVPPKFNPKIPRALDWRKMSGTPGTPADVTRVADISGVRGSQPSAIAKVIMPISDGLKEQGYKWFRVTAPVDEPDRIYLEAWKERPAIEGKLNRESATDDQA